LEDRQLGPKALVLRDKGKDLHCCSYILRVGMVHLG
jgi:hypothetical protein